MDDFHILMFDRPYYLWNTIVGGMAIFFLEEANFDELAHSDQR